MPFYKIHIDSLERIQRKFCKTLFFRNFGYYPERGIAYNELLQIVNIDSLQKRWITHQIMYLYKVVNNVIDDMDFLSKVMLHIPRFSARNSITFNYNISNSNQHMFSPLISMCRNYNHVQHCIDIFNCKEVVLRNSLKEVL